jgi:hypothetical protein
MHYFFDTAPIDWRQWLNILGVGVLVFISVELEKGFFRKRDKSINH